MTRRSLLPVTCVALALCVALPAGASDVPDGFSEVVVFATNSAMIKTDSSAVASGHVVVNDESLDDTLEKDFELGIGKDATIAATFVVGIQQNMIDSFVVGHRLRVRSGGTVGGAAYYNQVQIDNGGAIDGPQNSPVSLPFFATLPPFRTGAPGTVDVTIPAGTSQTLAAGDHGAVEVEGGATLVFSGGVYNLRSLTAGNLSSLQFEAPSEVRIDEKFKVGNDGAVGSAPGFGVQASRIVFFVNGINGNSGGLNHHPAAAEMGSNSTVDANFYAPNGRILLKDYTVATGAFVARDVQITKGVTVNLNSFFNEPPEPMDDAGSVPEGGVLNGSVLDNDDDPNADDALTVTTTPISGPSNGTLVLSPDGTFSYTHDGIVPGGDSFEYEVCDDGNPSECSMATVWITITAVNDPPTADPQSVSTDEDTALAITLTGDDGDPEVIQALTFAIDTPPSHGSISGDVAAGNITYTPNANYNGGDSFTFTVTDDATAGGGPITSAPATVTITVNAVNDPPTADPQSVSTDEDTAVAITLTGDDGDGEVVQTLTFAIDTPPSHGSIGGDVAAGNITYTPNANYNGGDSFTFTVTDDATAGGGPLTSAPATVTLTVDPVNDAPFVANPIPDVSVDENETSTVVDLTGVFDDVDIATDGQTLSLAVTSNSNEGLVTATLVGTSLTLDWVLNESGVATIGVTATDDHSSPLSVTDNFEAAKDFNVPPTGDSQTVETGGNTSIQITLTGTDPEGDLLDYTQVSGPSQGTLSGLPQFDVVDALVTYTVNQGAPPDPEDSFVFQVCDNGVPQRCGLGTVSINAPPDETQNDPPIAQADAIRVEPGETATELFPNGDASVLDNDSDPNGDILSVTAVPAGTSAHGTYSLNSDGTFSYTHDGGASTSDQFEYEVCDDGVDPGPLCSEATVFVTVEQATMRVTINISPSDPAGGSVVSNPAGIDCGTTCVWDFDTAVDLPISLVAQPSTGLVFGGWIGSADCADGELQVAADASCTALFVDPPPPGPDATVTVELAGDGGGLVTSSPGGINCGIDCAETVDFGTRVQLNAFPDDDSSFEGFSPKDPQNPDTVDTDCSDGELDGTVSADCVATFEALPAILYSLTVDFLGTGSGDVTSDGADLACSDDCSAFFGDGATVVLNARPAEGSTFGGYGPNCGTVDVEKPFEATITMGVDTVCTVIFNPAQ